MKEVCWDGFGHTEKMNKNQIEKQIYNGWRDGSRKSWLDGVDEIRKRDVRNLKDKKAINEAVQYCIGTW